MRECDEHVSARRRAHTHVCVSVCGYLGRAPQIKSLARTHGRQRGACSIRVIGPMQHRVGVVASLVAVGPCCAAAATCTLAAWQGVLHVSLQHTARQLRAPGLFDDSSIYLSHRAGVAQFRFQCVTVCAPRAGRTRVRHDAACYGHHTYECASTHTCTVCAARIAMALEPNAPMRALAERPHEHAPHTFSRVQQLAAPKA